MFIPQLLQILIICLGPLVCVRLLKRYPLQWLSPVVLAYLLGILLANLRLLPIDSSVSHTLSQASVVLAIPMLLYNTDLKAWLKQARPIILSFVLCVMSGLLSSLLIGWLLSDAFPKAWQLSGMLVGVYTGGTPNMQAIGMALGVEDEMYVLVNAADIFCGGFFLLFLTSVAHPFLGLFLPSFQQRGNGEEIIQPESGAIKWSHAWRIVILTIGIIVLSAGATYLVFGHLEQLAFLLLLLTGLSVLASLKPEVRALNGAYEMGEYMLLLFCVAVGMLSDFGRLWAEGGAIILYTAAVLTATVLLHLAGCFLFRIDRDSALITATAAIYGPVFIGQVASAIQNRRLIFGGIATGLVGYAIGNFLGFGVAQLLRWLTAA